MFYRNFKTYVFFNAISHMGIAAMYNAASNPHCALISLFHLYSTLLPQMIGRLTKPDLAVRSESFTPPRFSPSCPHCVRLWLDRGTIIGGWDRRNTACHGCFWIDWTRSAPYFSLFHLRFLGRYPQSPQAVFALLPHRFSPSGSSADVILPSDMTAFAVFVKVQGPEISWSPSLLSIADFFGFL